MKTLTHRSPYTNSTVELVFDTYKYDSTDNLCVIAYCKTEFGGWEPYANITVNLRDSLKDSYGYLDLNNLGNDIQDELKKAEIIEETNKFEFSGFCVYPLVRFNMGVLKEYCIK